MIEAAALLLVIAADSSSAAVTDSLKAAVSDSASVTMPALTDSAVVFHPHPAISALSNFRLEWSSDVVRTAFGSPEDPIDPNGLATIGHVIRLAPGTRTRELSQGPGPESFALDGHSSSASEHLLDGSSLSIPGMSGPHSEEVVLSEVADIAIVHGGAGALYGPSAAAGAVVIEPRFPHHNDLLSRAAIEEGVDEYQRASFQASRGLGERAAFFMSAESRRLDGFFPGTKEVDRYFVTRVDGALPWGLEGEVGYRRYEGDERSGGVDDLPVLPVETRRSDFTAKVFRPWNDARGALIEARLLRAKVTNLGDDGAPTRTREVETPELRATIDLPRFRKFEGTIRLEGAHERIESEEIASVDGFWRGGAALRWSGIVAGGLRMTETFRVDGTGGRDPALHGRFEGRWTRGRLALDGITSRSERMPGRGAEDPGVNEIHNALTGRASWRQGVVLLSVEGRATRIKDVRPEPTFEEVRRRDSAERAPIGTGVLRSATVALETHAFAFPGIAAVGHVTLRTSFGVLSAELDETGERLPNRPKRTWTGEGFIERRFFAGELLARVRGRLTHLGDRVDEEGAQVKDAWVTDVLLEGEIGDAVFFFRFHDLLERADEIEPGYRLPGFSRTYGLSWRFWG